MTTTSKQPLLQRLANILHVSYDDDPDYLSDILDQLIEAGDDPDDVVAYLSSFVADDHTNDYGGKEDLDVFARDVYRLKMGEDVPMPPSTAAATAASAKPSSNTTTTTTAAAARAVSSAAGTRILDEFAAQKEEIKQREMEAREKQREEQERLRQKKSREEREKEEKKRLQKQKQPDSRWGGGAEKIINNNNSSNNNKSNQSQIQNSMQSDKKKPASTQSSSAVNKNQNNNKSNKQKNSSQQSQHQPKQPLKGTPKKVCGCYGLKHKPLTNCLYCGRISCSYEGYDYCPFCNHLIEDFFSSNGVEEEDAATKHKNRLLEFDRTSAARTQIHDDQEDYFVSSTSMWNTREEQEDAREMEEERRKALHTRGKQVLNINF